MPKKESVEEDPLRFLITNIFHIIHYGNVIYAALKKGS